MSAASVGFTAWLLPEAGAALAVGLLAAGVGVPLVTGAVARRAERRLAPAAGTLATRVTDLLTGTAELTVAGALPARTAEARRADGTLTRIASRAAAATALGDGLTALVCRPDRRRDRARRAPRRSPTGDWAGWPWRSSS